MIVFVIKRIVYVRLFEGDLGFYFVIVIYAHLFSTLGNCHKFFLSNCLLKLNDACPCASPIL